MDIWEKNLNTGMERWHYAGETIAAVGESLKGKLLLRASTSRPTAIPARSSVEKESRDCLLAMTRMKMNNLLHFFVFHAKEQDHKIVFFLVFNAKLEIFVHRDFWNNRLDFGLIIDNLRGSYQVEL